jgi:hypothetical protein
VRFPWAAAMLTPGLLLAALTVAPAALPAPDEARNCRPIEAGDWRAERVVVHYGIGCRSATAKLQRWLARERRPPLPRNRIGWNCFRPMNAPTRWERACVKRLRAGRWPLFTFTLRVRGSAAAPIRECGDIRTDIYNVTSRVVSCRTARRLARRLVVIPACTEDQLCRYRGWRCRNVPFRVRGGYASGELLAEAAEEDRWRETFAGGGGALESARMGLLEAMREDALADPGSPNHRRPRTRTPPTSPSVGPT